MSGSSGKSEQQLFVIYTEACRHHEDGRLELAKAGYDSLLNEVGEAPVILYNLGLVYYEQEDFSEARDCFAKAVENNPEDSDAWFNLALSQKQCEQLDEAIESYQHVLLLTPGHIDGLYNLGVCYQESLCFAEAVVCYEKVVEIQPDHVAANNNLAYSCQRLGDDERAIVHYRRVTELDPEHKSARHMLAALTGKQVDGAPQEYVRAVFDSYSDRFEENLLEDLQYRVPERACELAEAFFGRGGKLGAVLDLGCGTGLAADALQGMFSSMEGVDISGGMLDVARTKGLYAVLAEQDIHEFLRDACTRQSYYDCFLALDVLAYVGDLDELFRLIGAVSRKAATGQSIENGAEAVYFMFSTEISSSEPQSEDENQPGYQLQASGRFSHAKSYIKKIAKRYGWEIMREEKNRLRREGERWLVGTLWLLKLKLAV